MAPIRAMATDQGALFCVDALGVGELDEIAVAADALWSTLDDG